MYVVPYKFIVVICGSTSLDFLWMLKLDKSFDKSLESSFDIESIIIY